MPHRRVPHLLITLCLGATGLTAVTTQAAQPATDGPDRSASARATESHRRIGDTLADDLTGSVIYQVVTDRFANADPTNDAPAASPGTASPDRSNWRLYWGGDFAGVAARIPYLKGLGVGALWISPPVQNIPVSVPAKPTPMAGYHGYWGMDFFAPDPHFGSWQDFDRMVATAHDAGIKIIMDWAPNHTSPADVADSSYGVAGRLQRAGQTLATYHDDPEGYFHHHGGITDYQDLYQAQYRNLFDLADLAQEKPQVTTYLKEAVDTWLAHGVDAIRMDAVKHMPSGWLTGYTNHIQSHRGTFVFGEWADPSSSPLWKDQVTFANTSGMSLQNFDLNSALRAGFAEGRSLRALDATVSRQQSSFTYPHTLINFVDSQDIPRFLSINPDTSLLDQATVAAMTLPGIPSIYYGDESYLHDDATNPFGQVGGDPYNRPMMAGFDQGTRNAAIVRKLSELRRNNPALRFGRSTQRWLDDDIYVYERRFAGNTALVAVNKSRTEERLLSGLRTALPPGQHPDRLGGQLGGGTLTVIGDGDGDGDQDHPTGEYVLRPGQAAVWAVTAQDPDGPQIGSIGPTAGHAGSRTALTGIGFGQDHGQVTVGGRPATVNSWAPHRIEVVLPDGVAPGQSTVEVKDTQGRGGNSIPYLVRTGPLTPVTVTVTGAPLGPGDQLFLTGDVAELGSWSTDPPACPGPMLSPGDGSRTLMVALPAGRHVEFKAVVRRPDGSLTWESGENHRYDVPTSATGSSTIAFRR
ncbi:alpha-amylase family glycosyl hydrolase [Austwickia chelonae]|uniref:alpha-amylase family glycosyl hydrolase n=1 Tax=Austwickia chelonae TaxID=100225 RepID=UPI000E271D64|nr:alpha-amylase family glycosyl hydrolase [Austwickia chelonae]